MAADVQDALDLWQTVQRIRPAFSLDNLTDNSFWLLSDKRQILVECFLVDQINPALEHVVAVQQHRFWLRHAWEDQEWIDVLEVLGERNKSPPLHVLLVLKEGQQSLNPGLRPVMH